VHALGRAGSRLEVGVGRVAEPVASAVRHGDLYVRTRRKRRKNRNGSNSSEKEND
jgi:hypothetical protein